jgi:TolB protein
METPEVVEKAHIRRNRQNTATLNLERVWNASENGWYAGDNHFHLNYGGQYRLEPEDILLELRGESMDFAYPLLANLHNRFNQTHLIDWRYDKGPIIEFGLEPRAHLLGHLNLLGIDELFWPWIWGPAYQVYSGDDRLNTAALRFARERGGLGGYVHPVFVDDPFAEENLGAAPAAFVADAVLGEVDLIEVACLWSWEIGTAALWHAVLNLGIPLAASAGSDAMNDLYRTFPTGSTRVYVNPEGELNTDSYLRALKQGNSFVSTGPMLEFEAGGSGPGGVIEPDADSVNWKLDVHSALPFDIVQIFINGEVVQEFEGNPEPGSKRYEDSVIVPEGGWITARVVGENTGWPAMDSYLFAESSPVWFHEIGSTDTVARKQAAENLLRVLDASQQVLKAGYGNSPIPRLMEHFARARKQLWTLWVD